jgi:RimJ/RimL family protein N-acetyltransferase
MPDRVYKTFRADDGKEITLRGLRWEDLDGCMAFARGLAAEHAGDINHGTLMARAPTRVEEADWLSECILAAETGDVVSVAADFDGTLIGNSEVRREKNDDILTSGVLGIAIAKPFRGLGIGTEMLATLLDECRRAGIKTVELRALAINAGALRLYERAGFKHVGVIRGKIRRRGMVFDEAIMAVEL